MNTEKIPKEWWVMRKGKSSWITESVLSGFDTPEEAYAKGMDWINDYITLKSK